MRKLDTAQKRAHDESKRKRAFKLDTVSASIARFYVRDISARTVLREECAHFSHYLRESAREHVNQY